MSPEDQQEFDEIFGDPLEVANELPTGKLSTVNILSLFETTRDQRNSFVLDVINRLTDEQIDPLKVHLQIKCMEDIINSLTCTDEKKNKTHWYAKTYKKLLLEAAEKQGKKFQFQNAEFSIKEVSTVYDFGKCNDPELEFLLLQQEEIKKKVDAKKEFLKTVPGAGMDVRFGDELVTVYPPAKSSTTSVSVTLK